MSEQITKEILAFISELPANTTINRYMYSKDHKSSNIKSPPSFSVNIEAIHSKNHLLSQAILKEDVIISMPLVELLASLPKEELLKIYNAVSACNHPCKIYHNNNTIGAGNAEIAVKAIRPGSKPIFPFMPIKQLPAYDPNAELSSLSLTIPSWIDSINRKFSNTDIAATSSYTRNKLIKALAHLKATADERIKLLEEAENEQ